MRQELIDLVRVQYKLAASKACMRMGNARSGRRPMSVDTLLRKEKEGSLYKQTEAIKKAALESGVPLPGTLEQPDRKKKVPPDSHKAPVDNTQNEPDTNLTQEFTPLNEFEKGGEDKKPVSFSEAANALKKLRKLEREKPTGEELTRGAVAGSLVGSGAALGGGMVSGAVPKAFRGAAGEGGYRNVARKTTLSKLRGVGSGMGSVGKSLAGAATGSAILASALPVVRRALDREAEKVKLREYLDVRPGTSLRRRITSHTGL